MYKAKFISPMIPSHDMKKTADFFKDILGFDSVMDTESYSICIKDNLTIPILPAGANIGEMEFYIEVDDVQGLWTAIKEKVKDIKHREPFDREYGMREIHIEIPCTSTLLFIGQVIND
jgi:catechol 2,3-dioxygenase-like lactoylglutathione lyase family enzyme